MVESFDSVVRLLEKNGYDESTNISDFYFANRQRLDPLIYGHGVHSDEFAQMVRWHSVVGIECRKAILDYFHAKIEKQKQNVLKNWFPKIKAMVDDPNWDGSVYDIADDLYVPIDFSDFRFRFNKRSLTIRDFVLAFRIGRIAPQIDLGGIDLSGIRLENCRLINLSFGRANFDGAKLGQVELVATHFSYTSFRNARLATIHVKQGSSFNGADFTGASVFGIFPLDDKSVSIPFVFNEVSYFYLVRVALKRFLRIGSSQIISQNPTRHTGFANNPTNGLTLPQTKQLKEYVLWYQKTLEKIDRLPVTSLSQGFGFLTSLFTTKQWTSFAALVLSAFWFTLFYALLYSNLACHFANEQIDLIEGFYHSVLVFTSFGLEKIQPTTDLGRFLVVSEILLGYVILAMFVYLMAKKIDRNF